MQEDDNQRQQQRPEEAATPEPGDEASAAREAEAGGDDVPPVADRVAALEGEAARLKDQLLRQLAETENVRRRAERERKDAAQYGASGLAKDLLNVADNLHRALQAVPGGAREADEAMKNLIVGIEATERELLAAFEKHAIKRVGAIGEKFSYELHQAMYEVPGTGQPAGTIVEMLQPGYVMHDRLLRPAMVGVAKAEAEAAGRSGSQGEADDSKGDGGRVDTTA